MRINIEIPDHHVTVLSKWASVCRMLRTAKSACEDAGQPNLDANTIEKYQWCATELAELIPSISDLHQIAQQEIWVKERKDQLKRHRLKVMDIHFSPILEGRVHPELRIERMMQDIQQNGQCQPVVAVPTNDGIWTLIDGLLRFLAIKRLGWVEIDAIELMF